MCMLHDVHDNQPTYLDSEQSNFLNDEKPSCNAHKAQRWCPSLWSFERPREHWGTNTEGDKELRCVSSAMKADNTSALDGVVGAFSNCLRIGSKSDHKPWQNWYMRNFSMNLLVLAQQPEHPCSHLGTMERKGLPHDQRQCNTPLWTSHSAEVHEVLALV